MEKEELITKVDSFVADHSLSEDFLTHHDEIITDPNSPRISLRTRVKNEKIGLFYVLLANFFWAFNSFYLKIVQRTYPKYFRSVPFLFIRAFMILTIAYTWGYIKREHILYPKEINHKFFFFIRTNLNFFSVAFFTMAVWYLRISTCQIIASLNPLIVIILSFFILKEKFHLRYAIGIIVCMIGSAVIISNEKKANKKESAKEDTNSFSKETIYGVICSLISVFLGGIITLANKVLAKNKIPVNTQLVYVGYSTLVYSFIYIIATWEFPVCFGYFIMCLIHGIFFFIANVFFNKGIQQVDLSKSVTASYTKIVFVFILGGIFLREPVYFTDVIGACLIVSYMLYNVLNPIIDK